MEAILRKSYVILEFNEYEEVGYVSNIEAKEHFLNYPWSDQLVLSEKMIEKHPLPSISFDLGESELVILSGESEKFSIEFKYRSFLLKTIRAFPYDRDEIKNIIDCYFNKSISQFLIEIRKKKFIENSLLMNLMMSVFPSKKKIVSDVTSLREYNYSFSTKRLLKILAFALIIFFTPTAFYLLTKSDYTDNTFLIFFQIIVTIISLPAFITAYTHYHFNKDLSLHFKKTNNNFIIKSPHKNWALSKEDVSNFTIFHTDSTRAPWGDFEYVKISMKNNEVFFVSNALIDVDKLIELLGVESIEKQHKLIPYMNKSIE